MDKTERKGFPHRIEARVSTKTYLKLLDLISKSENINMSSLVRQILEDRQIKILYVDISQDNLMEQLVQLHAELHRIGVNVNQVTKDFHQSRNAVHKIVLGNKLDQQLNLVRTQMKKLELGLLKIQEKWLSKS